MRADCAYLNACIQVAHIGRTVGVGGVLGALNKPLYIVRPHCASHHSLYIDYQEVTICLSFGFNALLLVVLVLGIYGLARCGCLAIAQCCAGRLGVTDMQIKINNKRD